MQALLWHNWTNSESSELVWSCCCRFHSLLSWRSSQIKIIILFIFYCSFWGKIVPIPVFQSQSSPFFSHNFRKKGKYVSEILLDSSFCDRTTGVWTEKLQRWHVMILVRSFWERLFFTFLYPMQEEYPKWIYESDWCLGLLAIHCHLGGCSK